jgi:hypothetical protein
MSTDPFQLVGGRYAAADWSLSPSWAQPTASTMRIEHALMMVLSSPVRYVRFRLRGGCDCSAVAPQRAAT